MSDPPTCGGPKLGFFPRINVIGIVYPPINVLRLAEGTSGNLKERRFQTMTYRGVGTEDHKWLAGCSVTGGLIARLEILVLGSHSGTSRPQNATGHFI